MVVVAVGIFFVRTRDAGESVKHPGGGGLKIGTMCWRIAPVTMTLGVLLIHYLKGGV
jgi:hypothetical protein